MNDPIRNIIGAVLDTAPEPPERRPVRPVVELDSHRRWPVSAAAAVIAGAGVIGLLSLVQPDRRDDSNVAVDIDATAPPSAAPAATTSPAPSTVAPETREASPPTGTLADGAPTDTTAQPLTFEDAFALLARAHSVSNQAVIETTRRCMEAVDLGFEPVPAGPIDPDQLAQIQRPWTRSNVPDSNGYSQSFRLPETVMPPNPARSPEFEAALFGQEIGTWSISPDEQLTTGQAVEGEIRDGCYPQALIEIVGGGDPARSARVGDIARYLQTVELDGRQAVMENPAIQNLETDWIDCMASVGFDYSSLSGPRAEFSISGDPTQREIDAASADRMCLEFTGIAARGDELFDEYGDDRRVEDAATLQSIRDELDAIIQRSEEALE